MSRWSRLVAAVPVAGLLLAGFMYAPPAQAADIGALSGTGERPGATRLPFTAGDSVQAQVDVGSGNLLVTVRGLELRGFLSNKQLGAFYNSAAVADGPSTRMGPGWGLDFTSDVQLQTHSDNSVTYHGPGGLTGNFPRVSGSTTAYTSAPGFKATLVKTSDGWTLTDRESREVRTFNSAGKLIRWADRNNDAMAINSTAGAGGSTDETVTASAGTAFSTTPGRRAVVATASEITTVKNDMTTPVREVQFKHVGNRMTEYRDALNRLTSFSYTSAGLLSSISAPGGVQTSFTYDSSRRITAITQAETSSGGPGSSTTRLRYPNVSPKLTQVADGTTDQSISVHLVPHTAYTLDANGRVTKAVDAEGRTQSRTYTPNFDTATAVNGTGSSAATTTNTYGANNGESLTQTKAPTGGTTSLTYASTAPNEYLPSSSSDDAGNSSTYTYSGTGNQLSSTDANAAEARLTYGSGGNVASATSPGNGTNRTVYSYTNRLLTTMTPVTGSSLGVRDYTYDNFGRLATSTNGRGITTTYTYDALDRVTKVAFTGGTQVTYGYDDAGRNNTRVDQYGTTTYGYDQLGRLTSRANSAGGGTITYTYDKASRLKSTDSAGGGLVEYFYDKAGVPSHLTYPGYPSNAGRQTLEFAVDSKGRRTHTWMNSTDNHTKWAARTVTSYDQSDRVTRIVSDRGTGDNDVKPVTDISYCYAAGSPTTSCSTSATADRSKLRWRKDNITGAVTTYTYDTSGRLTQANITGTGENKAYTYTYNARGNRLTAAGTAQTDRSWTYNPANQISSTGYSYDGAGNLTKDPQAGTIAYTAADQVQTVTKGGTPYQYRHAGTGNDELVYQTTPEGTYNYTYGRTNPAGVPIVENITKDGNTASVTSDPITGQPLMLRTASTMQSLYVNEGSVGSPIALITSLDYRAFAYEYDPFGIETLEHDSGGTGVAQNPFLFASGVQDRTTGWVHYGARYYNPNTGQFTQQDTLDAPLDPRNGNRYAYAGNDPINNIDPTGRESVSACLGNNVGRNIVTGAAAAGVAGLAGGPGTAGAGVVLGALGGFVGTSIGCAFDAAAPKYPGE